MMVLDVLLVFFINLAVGSKKFAKKLHTDMKIFEIAERMFSSTEGLSLSAKVVT